MQEAQKSLLLEEAKNQLKHVREKLHAVISHRDQKTKEMAKGALSLAKDDAWVQQYLAWHNQLQVENLKLLYPSPYFTRCDFEVNGEKKQIYIGKFSFADENVYSWVSPAATLRFENTGIASYTRPDGTVRKGILERKDQYMIVDGKFLFFAKEQIGQPRELIYQEHFTRQKQGFVLEEVVDQMEKAQDQVIRVAYKGPMVISGPAGSGKTTLALHRVAYLMQSPETMEWFRPETIAVLVQDVGTKEYFSQLLPDLGIKGVSIVTFSEWAFSVLGLFGYEYRTNYGVFEKQKVAYEYAKLRALRNTHLPPYEKNIFAYLQKVYATYFGEAEQKIFVWQKKEQILDRFDLSLLLMAYQKEYEQFVIKKEHFVESASGSYSRKNVSIPVLYNLMIVDEFQNYLPEQLAILQTCINPRLQSMVYVGDLAQQTQLGTIRSWESARISVNEERMVTLQKVYRNTKEILQYIQSLGYSVTVSEKMKSLPGSAKEVICKNKEEELQYIRKIIAEKNETAIGILARDKEYVQFFKQQFIDIPRVHCLSFYEAQGVEFDTVFIVGINANAFTISENIPEIQEELKNVEKDLLYVALTRAMSGLHVLGDGELKGAAKTIVR